MAPWIKLDIPYRSAQLEHNFISVSVLINRSCHPEVFLRKGVSKMCRKFTAVHPCRSVFPKKLQGNFIETKCRGNITFFAYVALSKTPPPLPTKTLGFKKDRSRSKEISFLFNMFFFIIWRRHFSRACTKNTLLQHSNINLNIWIQFEIQI